MGVSLLQQLVHQPPRCQNHPHTAVLPFGITHRILAGRLALRAEGLAGMANGMMSEKDPPPRPHLVSTLGQALGRPPGPRTTQTWPALKELLGTEGTGTDPGDLRARR